jgi:hypothetical protein
MKKILFILISAIISSLCYAQQPEAKNKITIGISARSYSDHIVLRYAPFTPILFSQANEAGYIIERADYKEGVLFEKLDYIPIKGSPFKRWNDEQWGKAIEQIDPKDSTNINLAGLASAFSEPGATLGSDDILKNGLQSLKEQKENADMRFGFVLIAANRNKIAAEGLALSVTDNNTVPGKTYVYRVHINQPLVNPKIEIAYIKVKCDEFNEKYLRNDKAIKLVEGDQKISFSFPESKEYYSFTVQRSDDGGLTYVRTSKLPKLNFKAEGYTGKTDFSFGDTGLINNKKYFYRIFVSTPFADELLLAEFIATPKDRTPPPAPFLKSADHINPKQVELTWEMTGEKAGDLKGFNIKRSNKEDGKFNLISKEILPANSLKYIDETFDTEGSNYYIVEAVDTAGNRSQSYPAYVTLIDSIPPAIPVISSAKIDSLGKIIIKVKPNIEKDFMGYQLLKANAKDHEFSVVIETYKDTLGHTTFTMYDSTTLNTLTKNIYYKVIALDTHFNQSAPSEIIELKKRDTIPPVSPLITGFNINDTSVVIRFVNSASEDAVGNFLLRRENGKIKFDTVFLNTNIKINKYIDKDIVGGRQYEYTMIAKDDGGLFSKTSKSIQLKTLMNNRIPAPVLKGSYDEKVKKVTLSFMIDDKLKNRKLKVEIFRRAEKDSAWDTYKIIEFEKGKIFLDETADGQKGMNYTIRLTDENKISSNFSNELELKF